jgi:hypothetical protein
MSSVYRPFVEKLGGANATTFVGDEGEIFYDPSSDTLRRSDGNTPGGVALTSVGSITSITSGGSSVVGVDTTTTGENALEFSSDNGTTSGVRWRITTDGHIIPNGNALYDIGDPENKVRDMYIDSGSIHTPSGNALSFYDGNLTWGGDDVIVLSDLKQMVSESSSFEDFKQKILGL